MLGAGDKLAQLSVTGVKPNFMHPDEGGALHATFLVDPHNVIEHLSVNNLNVGRNPWAILRLPDAFQTDELCPCNCAVDGEIPAAAHSRAHPRAVPLLADRPPPSVALPEAR